MGLGDLDRVMEIAAGTHEAPQWTRAVYMAAISEEATPRRVALVAESGGMTAGFAVASLVGQQAELESIAVEGELRGRGIGAALLGEIVAEAEVAGVEEMVLEVRASNLRAGRLYERAGFREVGRRKGYYREPVEDATLFTLVLGK